MQATNSLQELTVFLQKNSGKILNGRCNLSLTVHCLAHLNRCFKESDEESLLDSRSHDQNRSHDRRRPQTVMFLLSYVKKTPALKLIHPGSTLQGPVDISRFKSLTIVEIKKVPLHMLKGLGYLRHQLRVLICSRCVQSLQMLLCSCGSDMLSAEPWSSLHTLNLGYNNIDSLDESLTLLPMLKILDLSHNELKKTQDFLECLSELTHLNLGYNHLEHVPSLGLVARTNLQTLILRNNSLDNLSGLEDYSSLLELDLSNNCLYDGAELRTLGYLHNLREINLRGNPLAFDPNYRSIVIGKFPPEGATRKMYLDGVALISTEYQMIPSVSLTKPLPHIPSQISMDTSTSNLVNEISSFDESTDVDRPKRMKSKRMPKVRNVSIPDQGALKDESKSTATMLQDKDIADTKRELEKMRHLHGQDWLLALQSPYAESPNSSMSEAEKIVEQISQYRSQGDNSLGRRSSGIESDIGSTSINGNLTFHAEVNRNVQQHASAKVGNGFEDVADPMSRPDERLNHSGVKAKPRQVTSPRILLETKNSKPSIFLERIGSDSDAAFDTAHAPESEEHELCSPLLVTIQDFDQNQPKHLFLTVKETHLEEKDMYGHVTERLEIKCLKSMHPSMESVWDEEVNVTNIVPVAKLTFDYIRKDRKKREYILEDEESYQILSQTLQPFIEENRLAASAHKARFQCLKCSKEFAGNQAKKKHLATKNKGSLRGGYNSEEESNSDIEAWNEVRVCPVCSSTLIVELENPVSPSNHTSIFTTPTGSLNSLEMNIRPMATSSPGKFRDKDFVFVSSSERSRSGSSTEYHSAANSLSSSPTQTSSGVSTIINNSNLLSPSRVGRQRHITEETLDDECAQQEDHIPESKFTLPAPTVKLNREDETNPFENISTYQHEKLRELLQENMAPFSQKYSLVPSDILDGLASREASGSVTPHSTEGTENGETVPDGKGEQNKSRQNGLTPKTKSSSLSSCQNRSESTKNVKSLQNQHSRPCSEDDIIILPAESTSESHLTGFQGSDNVPLGTDLDTTTSNATILEVGRAGSTDSEIAVLRTNSVDGVSIASDSVFDSSLNDGQTNLASALSDAASRLDVNRSPGPASSDKESLDTEASALTPTNIERSISKESSSLEASLAVSVPRKHSILDVRNTDFSNVDHRLKLYFSMCVFSNDEEFACMTKCRIFQFSKVTNFAGLLVISTLNIYIMRVSKETSENLSDVLSKRTQHSLRDLLHVHIGLGSQSFQLDFHNEGVLYTVVMRDSEMCEPFLVQFEKAIQRAPLKKCRFKGIVRDHPNTLMNLMRQVIGESASDDEVMQDVAVEISLYMLAYQKTTKNVRKGLLRLDRKPKRHNAKTMALDLVPVSILVTPSDVYLAEENHFWPLRLAKRKGQTKTPQFVLKDHYKISDIGEVELYEDTPADISLVFFHEDTAEQSYWHLQTENASSRYRLIDAIQMPWKEMFGVDLKMTIHPSLEMEEEAFE